MVGRREFVRLGAAGSAALSLDPSLLPSLLAREPITRAIPATGERLPVVGLGSAASFKATATDGDAESLGAVFRALLDNGGRVFDTSPTYWDAEEVAGSIANRLGLQSRIFWATKVNVARKGVADPAEARAQLETSFRRINLPRIDCVQVHNLTDVPVQLALLKEFKAQGRIRYIGVTITGEDRYDDLERVMRSEPLDFIGVDYAVDKREAEDRILPLAQDRGIAVLGYLPFGDQRLWSRVAGREVPAWAREFDAETWAQFFLKYVVSHPAITVATPATSNAGHMLDNLAGGSGALPDAALRRRMVDFVAALPDAQPFAPRVRGGG